MRRTSFVLRIATPLLIAACGIPYVAAAERESPLAASYLEAGTLADGATVLEQRLKEVPDDDEARFGLGVLEFCQAVEHLGQSLYRYGLEDRTGAPFPILRLPTETNPQPERLSYPASRKVLQRWVDDLARAENTLAAVKAAEVKLPLHMGRIRLDLNGDGTAKGDETLWRLFGRMNRQAARDPGMDERARTFVIAFDKADVYWLRGYCHLLMTLGEVMLAHDFHEVFERTAHLFFPKVETPYGFLEHRGVFEAGGMDITDCIALVHLLNFPVTEPARMTAALEHLQAVIALSRQSWDQLLAETDDDAEWIPNPKQEGVIPGVKINTPMIDGWREFLDEAEAILAGKKLVPFWRDPQRGINLRRVFTEPRTLDVVLWVQGTAAAPYLEEGPLSKPDTWQRFNRLFQGEFVGFALWFN